MQCREFSLNWHVSSSCPDILDMEGMGHMLCLKIWIDWLFEFQSLFRHKLHLTNSPWKQGTINCAILGSGIGGDPRRKWEEMGEQEREREREGERKVLLLFAKWSKRTIEMQEVYILPLKKPGLRHLLRLSKKVEHTLEERIILNYFLWKRMFNFFDNRDKCRKPGFWESI